MTKDAIIHEAVRSLGENDLTALYRHEIPTYHFMKVMGEMIDKAIVNLFQEGKIKKGTDLYNKFIEMFPGGDSKIGKKEIVRFVKCSDRLPKKEGYYYVRFRYNVSGGCIFNDGKWTDYPIGNDLRYPMDWLEVIPAKEEFKPEEVEIRIDQYSVTMTYKGKEWKFTPGLNWNEQAYKRINAMFDEIKEWYLRN